jgi:N-dimethylarginine dimethylaminohydrolase
VNRQITHLRNAVHVCDYLFRHWFEFHEELAQLIEVRGVDLWVILYEIGDECHHIDLLLNHIQIDVILRAIRVIQPE